jgi:hypothetical protein
MTPEAKSLPSERRMLIGRDRELAEVGAILEQRKPALVIVSAVTGMGKTRLLQMIAARAVEQGWHAAYSDSEGELSVVPATTEESFRDRLLELLDISTEDGVSDTTTGRSRPLHLLAERLRRRAPALVVIDGYRPEPGFASWFVNRFIKDVRQAGTPVVVVVADQAGNVEGLRPSADKTLTLGPLDWQAIRDHFESVGQQIAPPMEPAELEVYVEAASKDPEKLDILTRVLTLAQPGEGRTGSSTLTYGDDQ